MDRIILIFVFIAFSFRLLAQPGNPAADPDVPISGVEILLSVGALFGIKKLLKPKQK